MLPFLLLLTAVASVSADTPRVFVRVNTDHGEVEGETFTLNTGKKVSRWYGIPFGAPIDSVTRFNPPVDPAPWDNVRYCHRLPPACPQWPAGLLWISNPLWWDYQEDCLYLNVYTPADFDPKNLKPVMVWFHGGGFIAGGLHQYPGHFLAARDVVVVTVNYRISALGFMSTGDDVVPGNMGMQDQQAALRWVRDNIHNMGGNKDMVTLFGQSAGSASSTHHQFMPDSKGLFHQIIGESGSSLAVWAMNTPDAKPEQYTKDNAANWGCPTEPSSAMMDCLRTVDINDMINAKVTCTPGFFCQGFAPVADGKIFPDTPIIMRRAGNFVKCPMLMGHCKDDGSAYTAILVPESMNGGFDREHYMKYMKEQLMDIFLPRAPEATEAAMKALDFYYSRWPELDDLDLNRDAFNELITDFGFGSPMDVTVKSQAMYVSDIYYYVIGYRPKKADRVIPEWMGVPHNGELPYVWGWPLLKLNKEIRMDAAIPIDIINWDEEDQEWSDYILTMWTNFAKYGNPTPEPVPAPRGNPDTVWKKYNTNTFEYQYLDRTNEERRNYRQRNMAFWQNFFPSQADYKLFPAGEPLIHPRNAEGGWKTWGNATTLPIRSPYTNATDKPNPTAKGYDAGKFAQNMFNMYTSQLDHAMKDGDHKELQDIVSSFLKGLVY